MEFLLILAILPAVVLLVYVYLKDKVEKEPGKLLLRLFLFGVLAGPCAAIVESILFYFFDAVIPSGVLLIIIENFIGVACVEEGFKYLFLNTVRKNPAFNYVFDAVVYSVCVTLGFATLENILYVFSEGGGLEVALMRAVFSVPGHFANGVVMGCFYGLAKKYQMEGHRQYATTYYWLAFLLPALEHGFYDAALSMESDVLAIVALVMELCFIGIAFFLVRKFSKEDRPLHWSTRYPQQVSVQQPPYVQQQQPMQQPYVQQQQPYTQQQPVQQPYEPQQQPYVQQQTMQQQPYVRQPQQPVQRGYDQQQYQQYVQQQQQQFPPQNPQN